MVSVIVPVYNVEKYLRKCFNSLINQTYKEIEVIVVDDGSTDGSGKICDEYSQKYTFFKVIHKENAGLGMARNTGLEYAKGQYVTFIDSDDYINPDHIENLHSSVSKNKVDVCKSGFRRVSDNNKTIELIQYSREMFLGDDARNYFLPRMIGSSPIKKDSIEMAVCATIYNMEHIRRHNIRFPSERDLISEDLVFNIDYMQYANGAYVIPYIGYNYRYNPNSLTKEYNPNRFNKSCYFYESMQSKLKDLGYNQETLVRLQRNFFVYIRMSISQENKKSSNLTAKECKNNIKIICDDIVVQGAIKNYPQKGLGVKQKVFLWMIEHKLVGLLYMLSELKFM